MEKSQDSHTLPYTDVYTLYTTREEQLGYCECEKEKGVELVMGLKIDQS